MRISARSAIRCLAALAALGAAAIIPSAAIADQTGCGNTVVRPLGSAGGGSSFTRAGSNTFTYTSTDVPKATADGSTVSSLITVSAAGKLRNIKVTVGQLTHPADKELRLTLLSPDGTRIVLADGLGGNGANYTGTVFTLAAPSIVNGSAPFTGTFAPQGDFTRIFDKDMLGSWRLEINDAAGGSAGTLNSWSLELTRQQCGAHPTASATATPNPVSPGSSTTFDASASTGTNNATITKYEWDLDGDGIYETDTGTTPTVTHSYPTRGVVPVGLRITDSTTATDETILSLPVTQAPFATFTIAPSTSPLSLTPVTLDASGSSDPDPGGSVVRYEWDLDGNGTYETDAGSNPVLNTQFTTSGSRDVHLRVTNDMGATAIFTIPVVVANQPPVASFNVQNPPAIVGAPTTLDAGPSADPDGTIARYQWDLDNDGTYETDGGTLKTIQKTFPASGTYTVGLKVTDNSGASSTFSKSFIATQAPVAQVGASTTEVRPNTPVTFDPAGSADPDVGGSVVLYEWDFDGDGTVDQTTTTPTPVTHSYGTVGTYNATLIVTDDKGAKGVKVIVINVVNKVPVGVLTVNPTLAKSGEQVQFDASGSYDPDGTVTHYEWDLDGNGSFETDTGATPRVSRSYPNRIRATVRVRVTDNDGATGVGTAALAVDGTLGSGSTNPPGSGKGPDGSASAVFKASLLGKSIQKIKAALKKGVGVVCQVDRKATCCRPDRRARQGRQAPAPRQGQEGQEVDADRERQGRDEGVRQQGRDPEALQGRQEGLQAGQEDHARRAGHRDRRGDGQEGQAQPRRATAQVGRSPGAPSRRLRAPRLGRI